MQGAAKVLLGASGATKIFVQLLVMSDYTKVVREKREDINDFYSETCQGICYHNIKLPSLHQFGKIGLK